MRPVTTFPEHHQAAANPLLLVKVLSNSTEKYDRGEKFRLYRQITTFQEYVLIPQDKPLIEVYFKLDNNVWRMSTYEGLDKLTRLDSIGVTISMQEIYRDAELNLSEDETC